MSEIHPGSFVGDSVEEFKKLPTWGKIGVGAVVLIVVGIGVYEAHKQAAANASGASVLPPSATTSASGSQSPFPMINGQPLLPSGYNPIFDPSGGVVGYQGPPPAPTPTPTPAPAPAPAPITNWIGHIPNFSKIIEGGADAGGQRYWFMAPGATKAQLFYLPTGSKVNAGGDGRWWYTPSGGKQVALTQNGASSSAVTPMVMGNASNPSLAPAMPKVR